jgi:DNA-binding transcriptional LysR family regulator
MQRRGLDDLATFMAVAEHRGFRAAAARLGVTPSALSHTLRQLEDRLGVRLLHRTTRSVSLTDTGGRLLARLRPALEQVFGALDDLNLERGRPFGRLRVYLTRMSAAAVIGPVWQRYVASYPDVQLELHVGEPAVDIVAHGFDAGIGPRDRVAADMVAVRVMGPLKVAVVGAPAYFARHGRPRVPADLARHSCVRYRRPDGTAFEWLFERNGRSQKLQVDGRVMVNDLDLSLRAAVDGLGLVYTIEAQAEPFLRSGQLARVLDAWSPSFEGLFLYYPGHRQVPAALRALIDLVCPATGAVAPDVSEANPFMED